VTIVPIEPVTDILNTPNYINSGAEKLSSDPAELLKQVQQLREKLAELQGAKPIPESVKSGPEYFPEFSYYISTYKGQKLLTNTTTIPSWRNILLSAVAGFIIISVLGLIHQYGFENTNPRLIALIAPWGSAAVILCASTASPLSQPRNVVLGNVIAGVVGVCVQQIFINFDQLYWFKASFAVAITIVLQQLTKSVHPPGGSVAVAAVVLQDIGWWYILTPVLLSVPIFVILTIVLMNIRRNSQYPRFWL